MTHITLKTIYDAIQDLREEVKSTYVTQEAFNPVRTIVYGMVGLLLTAVFVALIARVVTAIGF